MSEREHVRGMKKQTDNKYLNMYELNAVDKNGREHPYYFATRRKDGDLMCQTGELKADGTVMYAVLKDDPEKIVMVRQYRYPINIFTNFPQVLLTRGRLQNRLLSGK